jgi:hypothetical protein
MDKDKALKRALEALEAHADIGIKSDKAITAIKQALAAQPAVQEPVAWMAESKNGNVRFTNIGQSADQLESFGWTISPLYAAPFQFQPLTEEAVLECWKQVYEPGRREHDNATRMARAIEAAHGITKGQP